MSVNKFNILQIRKYLNGELDARAMHELERQALDDPFLADALEGYERKGSQQHNLADIQKRLQHRTMPARKRLTLWPGLTIAASVLLFVAIGGWWLVSSRSSVMQKEGITPDKTLVNTKPVMPAVKAPVAKPDSAVLKPAGPNDLLLADNRRGITQNNSVGRYAPPQADMAVTPQAESTPDPSQATNEIFANSPKLALRQIKSSTNGLPGSSPDIKIRGLSTVNGGEPLIVVDGKIYSGDINTIKLADIQNVETLKGASATAIYGSKGANGVILFTTKLGSMARLKSDSVAAKNMLADVVITGYPAQYKREVTSSVANVKPAEIEQSLQGRVAGVQVSRTAKKQKQADTLRTITGQVLDARDGSPLPGVSVVGSNNRIVQTNANGQFKIQAAKEDELTLNFIGYERKRIKVKSKDSLNVSLSASTASLSEVAVVGYGTTSKEAEPARPQNGWNQFNQYLKENAKPVNAKIGVVRLSFVVNADRSLTNFKVLKSLSPEADKAAIQLVADGPAWLPNTNGKPETVKLRIKFRN